MDSEFDDYEIVKNSSGKKDIIIVSNAKTLLNLSKTIELSNVVVRLVLSSVDEELVDMLINLNLQFDIVYELKECSYAPFEILKKFIENTNNKVYVAYDIDNKTLFDRILLQYYIDHYHVKILLKSSSNELYKEWVNGMSEYVDKKSIKKLSKKFIGEK